MGRIIAWDGSNHQVKIQWFMCESYISYISIGRFPCMDGTSCWLNLIKKFFRSGNKQHILQSWLQENRWNTWILRVGQEQGKGTLVRSDSNDNHCLVGQECYQKWILLALRNVVNCQYGPNQESLLHRAVLENDRWHLILIVLTRRTMFIGKHFDSTVFEYNCGEYFTGNLLSCFCLRVPGKASWT